MIDTSQMDIAEMRALVEQLQADIQVRHEARQQAEAELNAGIVDAIPALDDLLGTTPAVKTNDPKNIEEMMLFTPAELQTHAGTAIWLMIRGMRILTMATRSIARVQQRVIL